MPKPTGDQLRQIRVTEAMLAPALDHIHVRVSDGRKRLYKEAAREKGYGEMEFSKAVIAALDEFFSVKREPVDTEEATSG